MQIFTNIQVVTHEEIQTIEKTGLPFGRYLSYDTKEGTYIAIDNIYGQVDKTVSGNWLVSLLHLEGLNETEVTRYSEQEHYEPCNAVDARMYRVYSNWKERIDSSRFAFLTDGSRANFELVTVKDAEDGKRQLFTNEGKTVEELSTETAFGHFEDARFFGQENYSVWDINFERVPTMVLKTFTTEEKKFRIRYSDTIAFGRVLVVSEYHNLGNAIHSFLQILDKTRVSTNGCKDVHDIHAIMLKRDKS